MQLKINIYPSIPTGWGLLCRLENMQWTCKASSKLDTLFAPHLHPWQGVSLQPQPSSLSYKPIPKKHPYSWLGQHYLVEPPVKCQRLPNHSMENIQDWSFEQMSNDHAIPAVVIRSPAQRWQRCAYYLILLDIVVSIISSRKIYKNV